MLKAVIILILANISLLVWSASVPEQREEEIPLTLDGIPELVLLPDVTGQLYSNNSANLASSCYSLGPFNSYRAAQIVGERIRNYGLAFTIRSIRSMETLRYLVYIPPLPSIEDAQNIKADLLEHHIKNVNVISEGPYKNAISIGFYSNLERAKRETEQIRYLGYDAQHSEEKSPLEVYWIDFDEPFASNTPVISWSRSVDPTAAVQRIPRACQPQP